MTAEDVLGLDEVFVFLGFGFCSLLVMIPKEKGCG